MRTLVISDAHGDPRLIENALTHGGFEPGRDGFVYTGDLLDRGEDAGGCIALVEQYATAVLLGNHEVAALLGLDVYPQNPDSPAFRPFLRDRVLAADPSKAWRVAVCVDGVLITHAGVGSQYDWILEEYEGDPARLADHLNETFLALVKREPPVGDWYEHDILAEDGPLWFRPWPYSALEPLTGCTQVAGHTPPLKDREGTGFHMIDPFEFEEIEDEGRYRYAAIEDGQVRVEDGTLGPTSFDDPPDDPPDDLPNDSPEEEGAKWTSSPR